MPGARARRRHGARVRRRHRDPQPRRELMARGTRRLHLLLTHLHLDHLEGLRFFGPMWDDAGRSTSGARPRRRWRSTSGSRVRSRRRSSRWSSRTCRPASSSTTFRGAAGGSVTRCERDLRRASGADGRLPDRAERLVARVHPGPRACARRLDRRPDAGLALGCPDRCRRRRAVPRCAVLGGGVPGPDRGATRASRTRSPSRKLSASGGC